MILEWFQCLWNQTDLIAIPPITTVWPQASYPTYVGLTFLICKVKVITTSISIILLRNWNNTCSYKVSPNGSNCIIIPPGKGEFSRKTDPQAIGVTGEVAAREQPGRRVLWMGEQTKGTQMTYGWRSCLYGSLREGMLSPGKASEAARCPRSPQGDA